MCGEIDEQVVIGNEVLDRARALARQMNLPEPGSTGQGPKNLAEAEGRAAYMERIFRAALSQAFSDVAKAKDDETIDALAAQSIALARVAGFLAGQLPPEADLYRAVIESAGAGHAQAKDELQSATEHAHHHHDHHHHH